jgi:hypothetical protein
VSFGLGWPVRCQWFAFLVWYWQCIFGVLLHAIIWAGGSEGVLPHVCQRGWLAVGHGGLEVVCLLLPTDNLGPYTKEVELFVIEEGGVVGIVGVLTGKDEGGLSTNIIGEGAFNLAWFLHDSEGYIMRVMGNECLVAFVQGSWTSIYANTSGNAVYK